MGVPGGGTEPPVTAEELEHLTQEEKDLLANPRFGVPRPDAEEDDPLDREPTDVNVIIDDSGMLEPVAVARDEFDGVDEVV
jgi:hypothetical protein